MTFMIVWSLGRAHFKVTILDSRENGAGPQVGVTQLDQWLFPTIRGRRAE
jgi:hypothetical protein